MHTPCFREIFVKSFGEKSRLCPVKGLTANQNKKYKKNRRILKKVLAKKKTIW